MTTEKIIKIIKIIDMVSGVVTVGTFLISKSGIVSFLLFMLTLLLNFYVKILENEEKIKLIIRKNLLAFNVNLSANYYFIIVSISYIVFEIIISMLGKSVGALFLFMIIIPICYSLSILGILVINDYPSNIFGMIQCFITPLPYYMMILFILLDHNGFWFEVGTVIMGVVFYIPVGFVSKYVKNKMTKSL